MPNKSLGHRAKHMSKLSSVLKPTNGKSQPGQVMVVRPSFTSFQAEPAEEEAVVEEIPEPVAEVSRSRLSKLSRNRLQLWSRNWPSWRRFSKLKISSSSSKKGRSWCKPALKLERFQISSNDFNCSMRLNDSDGNVFTTSFTPASRKSLIFSGHHSMQASMMWKARSVLNLREFHPWGRNSRF